MDESEDGMTDSYRDSIEGVRQEEIATLRSRIVELERQRDLALAGEQEKACRLADLERAARSLIDRWDFWRSCHTLPGEYDNLVDALKGEK